MYNKWINDVTLLLYYTNTSWMRLQPSELADTKSVAALNESNNQYYLC